MVTARTLRSTTRNLRALFPIAPFIAVLTLLFTQVIGAQNYTVVGEVWNDANCDGLRQSTEAPLPGINVALIGQGTDQQIFTADDRMLEGRTTISPVGTFSFSRGGPYGDLYAVVIYNADKPAGFKPAPYQQGGDRALDNDLYMPLESQGSPLWATTAFEMHTDRSAVTDIDIGLAPTGCTNQLPHPGHDNDLFLPLLRS
jgi:hypothetical protein